MSRQRIARLLLSLSLTGAAGIALAADPSPAEDAGLDLNDAPQAALDPRTERARMLVEQGVRFEYGDGLIKDYSRALALYCAAARAEFPEAFVRLGWLYGNGHGVVRSEAVAHTLFRRAASLGSDMGAQLTEMFRGAGEQTPACLGGAEPVAEPPKEAKVSPALLATLQAAAPVAITEPAQFRAAPAPIEKRKVVEIVVKLARQLRLDPRLVLALINTESGFDPMARSNKNAQGLMQLIPDTAERFAVKDLFDPLENLRGGMSYLRWLLAYFRGDVVLAIAAYNAGEGAVDRYKGVPPYAETLAYVQKIRTVYPMDYHPFDPAAAAASLIFNVRRDPPAAQAARPPRS